MRRWMMRIRRMCMKTLAGGLPASEIELQIKVLRMY